ncbi:hypothetical protein Poli38472_008978 [Pythium oligandrum]|uniref:Uncharacterized protein n=1 Tax=Pythium oligandrum TaxID=41045 RepID=A0A8K1CLC0_PYTOL|nr:hypothetical protein Poli38472_008978 [Pythium oligandrum]|eukprot:TMW64811.1 hypothetical protein Poli38472_008978 [Pythium oligandrum]
MAMPSAAPPSLDERLPLFSTKDKELRAHKLENRNGVLFAVPAHSSVLLKILAPKSHSYEERDLRWLHLLQAVAAVPSRKVETIAKLVQQAMQMVPSPTYRRTLEQMLRGLLDVLTKTDSTLSFSTQALLALRVKDQVATFLRQWIQDPIEGFVLRKEHVVGGMRMDDLVATPVGAGYLRAFRREDQFCIVVFPWGHGFVRLSTIERVEDAVVQQRAKRRHNEYLALEHQHLYEQVESLLENYPAESTLNYGMNGDNPDGVNVAEYEQLLASLQEEHYDTEVLQRDLSFVRRVQALATKLKRQRTQQPADEDMEEEEEGEEEEEDEGNVAEAAPAEAKDDDDDIEMAS